MSQGQPPQLNGLKDAECEAYADLRRWYPPLPLPF